MQDLKEKTGNNFSEYDEYIEKFISTYSHKENSFEKMREKRIERKIFITDLCILLQECSRRSINWPIIKLGKLIQDGEYYLFDKSLPGE